MIGVEVHQNVVVLVRPRGVGCCSPQFDAKKAASGISHLRRLQIDDFTFHNYSPIPSFTFKRKTPDLPASYFCISARFNNALGQSDNYSPSAFRNSLTFVDLVVGNLKLAVVGRRKAQKTTQIQNIVMPVIRSNNVLSNI